MILTKGSGIWCKDISKTDKAYLAGVIDGEGSISINRSTRGAAGGTSRGSDGRIRYSLTLGVEMCDIEPVTFFADLFGRSVLFRKDTLHGKTRNQPLFGAFASGTEAQSILEELLPYLRGKKKQALIALEFPIGESTHVATEDELAQRDTLMLAIRKLHHR